MTLRSGENGTTRQKTVKQFDTAEVADADATWLIAEKAKKGSVEVEA